MSLAPLLGELELRQLCVKLQEGGKGVEQSFHRVETWAHWGSSTKLPDVLGAYLSVCVQGEPPAPLNFLPQL